MSILSLDEYKKRRQLTEASTERDEAITAALASAEDAVLNYTDRDFTTAQTIETKPYVYGGEGILETDDFVELTGLTVEGTTLTSGLNYIAGPREGQTFYWIDFKAVPRQSPQMGFTRNLDRIFAREFEMLPGQTGRSFVNVQVSAKFGWPGGAPAGVQQAVTWLVDEFRKANGNLGDVQAESVANLSYVYQREREEQHELPARVMALLDPYRRIAL